EDMGLQSDVPAQAKANQTNKQELDRLITAAAAADAQAARLQATLNATVKELDVVRSRNYNLEADRQEVTVSRATDHSLHYSQVMPTPGQVDKRNADAAVLSGKVTESWFMENTTQALPGVRTSIGVTDGTSNTLSANRPWRAINGNADYES